MNRFGWIGIAIVTASMAGCVEARPGRSRVLGEVDYALAFATAKEVMAANELPVETWDIDTGVIRARPKPVRADWDRPLGGYPARQVATMRIRRDGKEVVAHLAVAIQRQRSQMRRQMRQVGDNYDSVPNKSPAEEDAATTIDQNENWEVQRYAHDMEARILDALYNALHPEEK